MNRNRSHSAFTLLEVLIVVTIVAVLAGVVITQFGTAVEDAKLSALKVDLQKLRTLIECYKMDHLTVAPDGTNNLAQLVASTNVQGQIGAAGPNYPYGPYLIGNIPANPFSGSRKVTLYTGSGTPTPTGTSDGGWLYQPSTGGVWCDDAKHISN